MYGGACLILYCVGVVVLSHTLAVGVPRVGLTVTPQGPAVELYDRPFVVRKPSVATYAGPLLQIQVWNAVISPELKIPSPFPSVNQFGGVGPEGSWVRVLTRYCRRSR